MHIISAQIARFVGPTWGPPGSCRPQMGPMLAPWTLLSGSGMNLAPQLPQQPACGTFRKKASDTWALNSYNPSCSLTMSDKLLPSNLLFDTRVHIVTMATKLQSYQDSCWGHLPSCLAGQIECIPWCHQSWAFYLAWSNSWHHMARVFDKLCWVIEA